jgi:hypothetical protein
MALSISDKRGRGTFRDMQWAENRDGCIDGERRLAEGMRWCLPPLFMDACSNGVCNRHTWALAAGYHKETTRGYILESMADGAGDVKRCGVHPLRFANSVVDQSSVHLRRCIEQTQSSLSWKYGWEDRSLPILELRKAAFGRAWAL